MIKIENLSKSYEKGKNAIDSISFEVNDGDICGFIGTNGAGKSTTIKIINGALNFDTGIVTVNNMDVRKSSFEIKKITGYVPETANLFNALTAIEYFTFIGTIRNIENNLLNKRIEYFSELFEFKDFLSQAIGNLSKGNKQKVLITSTFLHNPQIILLDEPLNGLDANSIFIFQEIIKSFSEKGKTIFYCSHLLEMIEKISSKLIVIDSGKIVLDKRKEELNKSLEFKGLEKMFKDLRNDSKSKEFNYDEVFD